MQNLLDRLLATQAFDLVHVEDNALADYRYMTSVPRLLTEHDVRIPVDGEFDVAFLPIADHPLLRIQLIHQAINAGEQRRWQRYQPAAWRRFDLIQVFTKRDAAAIAKIAPNVASRLRVNPFGAYPQPQANPALELSDSIIFVGMFLHPANVDAAIWLATEIMPLLRVRRPAVRLTIVGGNAPDSVLKLAADDISVLGFVPDVQAYIEQAAIVVAPLRIGGGMRMKVLQAMSLGKAVIATPLGAEGLSVDGTQPPVAISSEANGIARLVCDLLSSDEVRHDLGRRAREFVLEHFSWKAYGQRLEAIYGELKSMAHQKHEGSPR